RRLSEPSLLHAAAAARRRREELAEEMRLLYVAMTRAQERLVLVGSGKLGAKAPDWASHLPGDVGPLADEQLLAAEGWLDWLGPAWMRHPHAKALWEVAGLDEPPRLLKDDPSQWDIRVWSVRDVTALREEQAKSAPVRVSWEAVAALRPLTEAAGEDGARRLTADSSRFQQVRGQLERRLGWRYPWGEEVRRPAKQGV